MIQIQREKLVSLIAFLFFLSSFSNAQDHQADHSHFAKEVSVFNAKDSVTLAGTLTAPDSTGSFPLAIFISGSGPQDRYQTIGKHRPFLVLSNKLNQLGFATLYFDDRGTGASTGDKYTLDFQIEMEDHQLIIQSVPGIGLKNNMEFTQTGLIGHSLGGMLALELSKENELDFYVLLATPFEKGTEFMLKQKLNVESLYEGVNKDEIVRSVSNMRKIYDFFLEHKEHPALDSLLLIKLSSLDSTNAMNQKVREGMVYQLTQTALFDILQYDPMQNGYAFDAPTLFIYGSKDLQVPPEQSIENLNQLMKGEISKIDYILMGGLNHLLQKSKDGNPMDYYFIDEAINKMAVEVIGGWMKFNVKN